MRIHPVQGSSRAWIIFLIAAMGVPFQFYLQSAPAFMIADLQLAFGLSKMQIGLLTSCFFYSYLLFQIPAGIFVDRVGFRRALLLGFVGCVVSCVIFASSHGVVGLVISRLLLGLSAASFVPAAMTAAQAWHPIARFSFFAGLAESIGMGGGALGQEGLGAAVAYLDWRGAMWASAVLGVVLLILVYFVVKDDPRQLRQSMGCQPTDQNLFPALKSVLRIRSLWYLAAFTGLIFAILVAFAGLWAVPYFTLRYHLAVNKTAMIVSFVYMGTAVFAPISGYLFSTVRRSSIIFGCLTCLVLLMYVVVLFVPLPSEWVFVPLFLLGAGASVYVLPFALIPSCVPLSLRGAAVGFVNMGAMVFGAPLMQPLIGWWVKSAPGAEESLNYLHYQEALSVLLVGILMALCLIRFLPLPYLRSLSRT